MLCPAGWHVPTDNDWKELEISLGMLAEVDSLGYRGTTQGSKMASNADLWIATETNEFSILELEFHFGFSGFNALPGGYIFSCSSGICDLKPGISGHWWTSTESNSDNAWSRSLKDFLTSVVRVDAEKKNGMSVRCVKD